MACNNAPSTSICLKEGLSFCPRPQGMALHPHGMQQGWFTYPCFKLSPTSSFLPPFSLVNIGVLHIFTISQSSVCRFDCNSGRLFISQFYVHKFDQNNPEYSSSQRKLRCSSISRIHSSIVYSSEVSYKFLISSQYDKPS